MSCECCICFEVIRSTENRPFATPCGHIFHEHCINSCFAKQNLCPQCNQSARRDQLIRLFFNQPENSVETTKDDMIEKLKLQLSELTEKAQLQYDLIAALNKQISHFESQNIQVKREPNWSRQSSSILNDISKGFSSQHQLKSASKSSNSPASFESIPLTTKRDLYEAIGCIIFGENSPEIKLKRNCNPNTTSATSAAGSSDIVNEILASTNIQQLTLSSGGLLGSTLNFAESLTTATSSTGTSISQPSTAKNRKQLPPAFGSSSNSSELRKPLKLLKEHGGQSAFQFPTSSTTTNFSTGFIFSLPSIGSSSNSDGKPTEIVSDFNETKTTASSGLVTSSSTPIDPNSLPCSSTGSSNATTTGSMNSTAGSFVLRPSILSTRYGDSSSNIYAYTSTSIDPSLNLFAYSSTGNSHSTTTTTINSLTRSSGSLPSIRLCDASSKTPVSKFRGTTTRKQGFETNRNCNVATSTMSFSTGSLDARPSIGSSENAENGNTNSTKSVFTFTPKVFSTNCLTGNKLSTPFDLNPTANVFTFSGNSNATAGANSSENVFENSANTAVLSDC